MAAQPVGEAAHSAPPADDPPVAAVDDDVDALAFEPAAFVEAAAAGAGRRGDPGEELEHCSLRRRTAER